MQYNMLHTHLKQKDKQINFRSYTVFAPSRSDWLSSCYHFSNFIKTDFDTHYYFTDAESLVHEFFTLYFKQIGKSGFWRKSLGWALIVMLVQNHSWR